MTEEQEAKHTEMSREIHERFTAQYPDVDRRISALVTEIVRCKMLAGRIRGEE